MDCSRHGSRFAPGTDYGYSLDGGPPLADPCSRWQPTGLRGPSRVLDTAAFEWTAEPVTVPLPDLVVYELHVGHVHSGGHVRRRDRAAPGAGGARRDRGRADAGRDVPRRARLGLRRCASPGRRIGPTAARGGSPGSSTPLTQAASPCCWTSSTTTSARASELLSRSGRTSPTVTRRSGATRSTTRGRPCASGRSRTRSSGCADYRVDGLRLDATHAIFDDGEPHVLRELADRVHAVRPGALVIAETAIGDRRPIEEWGHDAQWDDSFHHALHVLLTGERDGYYEGYGTVADLARAFEATPPERLVICASNHDQIGNRAFGDRLPPAVRRLAAACVLFAPQVPLLFQGDEYGEAAPFRFFTDHDDPAIARRHARRPPPRVRPIRRVRRPGSARSAGAGDLRGLEDPPGERRPRAASLLRGPDRPPRTAAAEGRDARSTRPAGAAGTSRRRRADRRLRPSDR